jgi:hypothetical protein
MLALCAAYGWTAARSFGQAGAGTSATFASVPAAREALAREPLDQRVLADLSQALSSQGDNGQAERALRLAHQLGWRDESTQVRWIRNRLQHRDFADAALALDALLRQHPALVARGGLLEPLERAPPGRTALAARMNASTEWLRRYAGDWSGVSKGGRLLRGEMLKELARQGRPLGCPAVAGAADSLVQIGAIRLAKAVWRGHCRSDGGSPVDDVGLANIALDNRGGPFAWTVLANGALEVRLDPGGGPERRLWVTNRASWTLPFATKLLAAEPGRYRLSWRGDAAAEPPIVASVGCKPEGGEWLAPTLDRRTGRWSLEFTAGVGCPAWLTLAVRPKVERTPLARMTLTPL